MAPRVAEKVARTLSEGRRYFGSSGAFMSHVASDEEYNLEGLNAAYASECLRAERDTTRALKKWVEDKPNAVVIDSVLTPGQTLGPGVDSEAGIPLATDTDHIVLLGNEVILIDTKAWKKKKTYSLDSDGLALMTRKQFAESELFMSSALDLWLDYLSEDALLTGLVVVQQEESSVIRNENWFKASYRLVEKPRFIELLDEKYSLVSDADKECINSSLVSQLIVRCIRPYDPYLRVLSTQAISDFR